MPRVNFNVPFINEKGETVKQPKFDEAKTKVENGVVQRIVVTNEDGGAVMEPVIVRDLLFQIVTHQFPEDLQADFHTRSKRGKLARRIANSNEAAYKAEELVLIQELVAKGASSILFVSQIDDIINSEAPPKTASIEEEAA